MELYHLQTKLLQYNLKSLLYSFSENGVTLEAEDPTLIEKSVEQITKLFYKNFLKYNMYSDIFLVEYNLNLKTKQIIFSGCYLNDIKRVKESEFNEIFKYSDELVRKYAKFLHCERSIAKLKWSGKSIFNSQIMPSLTYFFPDYTLIDENLLLKFYFDMNLPVDLNFSPVAMKFQFHDAKTIILKTTIENLPETIREKYKKIFQFGDVFCEYDLQKKSIISIKSESLPVEDFLILKNNLTIDEIGEEEFENLKDLNIPTFISDVVIEICCDGRYDTNCMLSFFTEERDHIEKTLMDSF